MRVGLMFGSFNPLHVGHLVIADYMLDFCGLDEVWLVLSPQNPLKEANSLASDEHRAEMVRLGLASEAPDTVKLCDVELDMPRPSYTVDTLHRLGEMYPQHKFVVLLGSDCLDTLPQWKGYQELINGWDFYIYPRTAQAYRATMPSERFTMVDAPMFGISSTEVRRVIARGGDASGYMPSDEWSYIKNHGLYGCTQKSKMRWTTP